MISSLQNFIISCLEDKKAQDVVVIPLPKNSIVKCMIIATGTSVKNIRAIAEHVANELKNTYKINIHLEGMNGSDWVIVDANEIMVHILHKDARDKLQLETLYRYSKLI